MPGKQVVLGAYPNVVQAELVKDRLDAEGIPAFVADEATGHVYAGLETTLGGIRVLVREEDLAAAQDVLANLSHPLGTGVDSLSEEELAVLAEASPDAEPEPETEPGAGYVSSPEERRRTAAILVVLAFLFVTALVVLFTRGR